MPEKGMCKARRWDIAEIIKKLCKEKKVEIIEKKERQKYKKHIYHPVSMQQYMRVSNLWEHLIEEVHRWYMKRCECEV